MALIPRSFEALYNTAALLLAQGRRGEAQEMMVRAWKARPSHPGLDGERRIVVEALRQVLRDLPLDSAGAYLELARSDRARGETESALSWLAVLSRTHGLFPEAIELRAALEDEVE